MGTVAHIYNRPRIFGLRRDRISTVVAQLIDSGANICITGDASCLVNTVDIPPMPITVATAGDTISIDDCCTQRGYIPLSLTDSSLYWQVCYYCANIVETITSPQAVVATRQWWPQAISSTPGCKPDTKTTTRVLSDLIVQMDSSQCCSNWNAWKDYTTAR